MKIVLLDRDGTVAAEPSDCSVDSEAKIHIWSDTIQALRHLAENGFAAIFVTNQTAMAEGRLDEAQFWHIHNAMLERLQPSGLEILKTYLCEHGPNDDCSCRKPKPGMLHDAIHEFGLNPAEVFMIGDRPTDVQAGKAAGVRTILVETSKLSVCTGDIKPDHTVPTLLDAAKLVVTADKNLPVLA